MKRIRLHAVQSLAAVLLSCGTLTTNLQAQSDLAVTVSVPFRFTVGKQSLAPGTYRFSQESDPFLLSVLNVKTGGEQIFTVLPEQQGAFDSQGHVLFGKSGGASSLNEIHFPGTDTFCEVIQRHRVRKVEAKQSTPSNVMSLAQR